MKTKTDCCNKSFRKNTHTLTARRAWYHCVECGFTTIVDANQELEEVECYNGHRYISKFREECPKCGDHPINHKHIRYLAKS